MNRTKLSKYLNWFLRILIFFASYGYIYYQLVVMGKFQNLIDRLEVVTFSKAQILQIVLVILLVPVNWGLEAGKWRFLISKLEKISLYKAMKGVLTGLTVSTISPNRLGEFLGRLFFLENSNRVKAGLLSILGSFSQLIVTLVIGSVSFAWFISCFYAETFQYPDLFRFVVFISCILLSSIILYIYFRIKIVKSILGSFPSKWFRKSEVYINVLTYFSPLELRKVLIFSIIRYFIFSLQFYLLMRIMGITINYLEGIYLISLIYFLMSFIPTITLAELGLRGTVSMGIVELYFKSTPELIPMMSLGALAASSMIWILNLVIPALVGGLFMVHAKIVKE